MTIELEERVATEFENEMVVRARQNKLTKYDILYLICCRYEMPVRMNLIFTSLTLIGMYLLVGVFHNPFILLGISVMLSMYLAWWLYTPVLAIIATPFAIVLAIIMLIVGVMFCVA